eukprot:3800353-Prymnesium_polylepis.1
MPAPLLTAHALLLACSLNRWDFDEHALLASAELPAGLRSRKGCLRQTPNLLTEAAIELSPSMSSLSTASAGAASIESNVVLRCSAVLSSESWRETKEPTELRETERASKRPCFRCSSSGKKGL